MSYGVCRDLKKRVSTAYLAYGTIHSEYSLTLPNLPSKDTHNEMQPIRSWSHFYLTARVTILFLTLYVISFLMSFYHPSKGMPISMPWTYSSWDEQ